jgi:hypothetical protein
MLDAHLSARLVIGGSTNLCTACRHRRALRAASRYSIFVPNAFIPAAHDHRRNVCAVEQCGHAAALNRNYSTSTQMFARDDGGKL